MILVKFPSRERPEQFIRVLKGWVEKANDLSSIRFLFSFDVDDTSMHEIVPRIQELKVYGAVKWGERSTKIGAINRDINECGYEWKYVLVLSDDMECMVQGWDSAIREAFSSNFPDGDGLVWYFDGKQRDICTLPLMSRSYYERDGYIYHPDFISVFADNLQTDLARERGRLAFIVTVLASHRHPANYSDVKADNLHRTNETQAIWDKDKATYQRLNKRAQ